MPLASLLSASAGAQTLPPAVAPGAAAPTREQIEQRPPAAPEPPAARLTIEGGTTELYDVAVLPGITRPFTPGFSSPEMHRFVVHLPQDAEFPLAPLPKRFRPTHNQTAAEAPTDPRDAQS